MKRLMNGLMIWRSLAGFGAAAGLMLAGCQSSGRAQSSGPSGATAVSSPQLFDGMGSHRRAVTTSSPDAQRYFDQGLTFAYAFNHDEAIRSFEEAARLDPDCAMAWWGVSLCHGPHINNPAMTPERSQAAWDALVKARAAKSVSPVERELIAALGSRYGFPPPGDRIPLDHAYAGAMKQVWERHPNDADIGCLYAESLMDLRPWDLWTNRWTAGGMAQPGTEEVVATLEKVLVLNPAHPGANHLYIHAVEASPNPRRAMAAADRLRTLVPGCGHLVHMPSHIDVNTGQWQKASEANVRAAAADAAYRERSPRQGFYHVYMAHNHHFLAFSSMMEGRRAAAVDAAKAMIEGVPAEFLETSAAMIDPYMSIHTDVLMRFGRWDEVLRQPEPDARLPITRALRHFSRGVACSAKGDIAKARAEQAAFRADRAGVADDAMMAINRAHDVLDIADLMLEGEIAFRAGDLDRAVSSLREAAEREDRLRYMEPPEWIQPVRHALGAFLLDGGRYAEAEAVYREDLQRWPENGWSLFGLSRALEGQNRTGEAEEVHARFKRAWARADTKINASCLCASRELTRK